MTFFLGFEIGPDADWKHIARKVVLEGAAMEQKSDSSDIAFFHHLLEQFPQYRPAVTEAMAELLEDDEAKVRAAAVMFLEDYPDTALAGRLLAVASGRRDLYESVDNPLRPGEPLYLGLLSALFESGVGHAPTAEFMRTLLSDPKFSYKAFSYLVNEDPASLYPQLKKVLTPQNEMWQFLLRMLVMATDKDRFIDLAKHLRGLDPQIKKAAVDIMHDFGLEPAQAAQVETLLR